MVSATFVTRMTPPRHKRSGSSWPSWLALVLVVVAYLALAVSQGLFIVKSSADIPISDTWGYVSILTKFATTGHVAWSHIFRFYGDNRPAIERFGLLLDAKYFGLNVQLVKLLSVIVCLLESACAIWAFRYALPGSKPVVVLLAAFPAAVLIFCWNNWQNLLDEWNLMNLAAVAFMFLAVLLIVKVRSSGDKAILYLVLAMVTCAVASFTGESGTLSFIACGLVLWLPVSRARLVEKLAFSAVGIVFLGLYFSGSKKLAKGQPLSHIGKVIEFAVTCLGNALLGGGVRQLSEARAIGIAEVVVIVILAVVYLANKTLHGDRAIEVAAGLIVFGLMASVATGVTRLQLGLSTALSSRYIVLTAPVMIGIYLVLTRLFTIERASERRARRSVRRAVLLALPCVLAGTLAVSSIISDADQARSSRERRAYYVALKHMACDPGAYTTVQLSRFDHSGGLHPHAKKLLLEQIADLRKAKLSVFSGGACETYARESAHRVAIGNQTDETSFR